MSSFACDRQAPQSSSGRSLDSMSTALLCLDRESCAVLGADASDETLPEEGRPRQPSKVDSLPQRCARLKQLSMKPAWTDATQARMVLELDLDASTLLKGHGLGVTFWNDKGFLKVKHVLQGGFVAHWNCANPETRLARHDQIFAANGQAVTCNDANLLKFADRNGRLRLTIIKAKRVFKWAFADDSPRMWSPLRHPKSVIETLAALDGPNQQREVILADQEDEEQPFLSARGVIVFLEEAAAREAWECTFTGIENESLCSI